MDFLLCCPRGPDHQGRHAVPEAESAADGPPWAANAEKDRKRGKLANEAAQAARSNSNPKRSFGAVAIALTVAVFGALSLLIVDHGLWNRPHVESARAHAATEAAAEADGAIVTSTRRPSLY